MLKRKLLKRALPIILSVAMVFEMMPADALAAEYDEVGTVQETELEDNNSDSNETKADNTEITDEDVQEESSTENAVKESSTPQETETEDTGTDENMAVTGTETETEEKTGLLADDGTQPPQEEKTLAAKIVIDDRKVDAYAKEDNGFTRRLSESGLVFFTEYVEESKCGELQDAVKDWIDIEVDGERIDALEDKLTYNWVKKAESAEEKDTPLVNAVPRDTGVYELTISMDLTNLEGLCKKLESDVTLSLTIEKADIELEFGLETAPGKTAGEFIDKINEDYVIRYKNRNYTVSRDILAMKNAEGKEDPDKKLPLHIFMLDEGGARQPMEMTDRFDRTKDYVLTIDDIDLTENAAGNYKLSVDDSYMITVGERQKTQVRFERKNSGEDLIKMYDETKNWTIDEVTEGLFTEAVTDPAGAVTKAGGVPAVYIHGEDDEEDEFSVLLEGAELHVNWYTRIRLNNGAQYTVDEEAGEIRETENNTAYVYKPMASDPGDAGEYFIIWSYAGDDGAYEKSHSEAVRFTIDPAPVVIKTSQESVDEAGFSDGMTDEDVRKALAKIAYGVYPLVKNETTGVMETGDTEIWMTPDFFGTSYRGAVENQATQYYVPEFVLQRRVTKITEKGEATVTVDPKAVEWKTVALSGTEKLRVIIDAENDELEFNAVTAAELPNDVSKENLESVEFEFRIFFTGNKVVYDKDGYKVSAGISITDVTTNAANRNYLADITKKTLEDTAVTVHVKTAESVQIVTDAIVDAFIADNSDMLYPQPGQGEEPRNIHQGTLENPAVKIYDQKPLFTDRASYKKAAVHKSGEDGGIGEELSVSSTDEAIQYTWSYITLDKYEKYLETWDEVQRQYKDFEEYSNLGWGWTDVADGSLASFQWAGLYRLTVTYDDPAHEYRSAKAEVFFKVARQEVVIVPIGVQYVKNRDSIGTLSQYLSEKTENKKDFIIYKLPHNSMEEYRALTDETRREYELPTDEAIVEFEAKNGRNPDMNLDVAWEVLRKEKDPATGMDKEPEVWVKADGNFDDDFTYGVAVHWTGNLIEFESGNVWENYTTKDIKTYRETGEKKHHESVGAVQFYDRQIYAEVDAEKIKALGHEYDGNPVSLEEAAKALTFYTDEALTEDSKLATENVVNTTEEYDPAKVNIYWRKTDNKAVYANKNAVYGGTYTLALRFAGGTLTPAEDKPETAQDDSVITYAPGIIIYYVNDSDDADGSFTITPHEITITPRTLPESILVAGKKADVLLTEGIDVQGMIENDQMFFEYAEIAAGSFDITWDGSNEDGTDKEGFAYKYNIDKNGGYPAFNGAAQYIIQVDGREIKDPQNEYLRHGSTYTIKLTNELVSPLKESYRVTYGVTKAAIENRGNAEVTATDDNRLSANGIVYDFNGSTYTVKPRGAVRFYNNAVNVIGRDGAVVLNNTNILGFRIYAPKEFLNDFNAGKEKFVYRNAVWNAGGYFLGNDDWRGVVREGEMLQYIDVVFPLTKENKDRSFNITWEDGYTETFTLADIVLEEDLTKAVAPKSIAFNGVSTKMAVGEKQQLNIKITKAQLGDVIAIRYRIKGGDTKNDFISLDPETGVVTALKAGKTATVVEAYPVYQDAKGNFVPVLDNKGKEAKAASTKISVMEVPAASVKKIDAQGEQAKLYFTVPDAGYRREIYVVDVTKGTEYENRKKWKPADFNDAIAGMTNGEWENAGFALQPIYSYARNEDLDTKEANGEYDKKLKAHIITIDNLKAQHEYVIYVRNVSAARALDDGSVVTLSANGAVKKFKTTKPQVKGLELDFTIKTGENDKKNTVIHPVNEDGTIDVYSYEVDLSAKKAQLNVYGLFSDKAGGNEAAETEDLRRYSLVPLLKEEKSVLKNYQMPKLEYVVLDGFSKLPFYPGLSPSKYATISNKGLISLKGVDLNGEKTVCIYVRDGIQHKDDFRTDAMIELTITAKPASMTGKKVKMKVGQAVKLSDCLEYKDAKKKKIPKYRSCGVMITKEMLAAAEANGYRIEDFGQDRLTHDWYITAVSLNKTNFDLTVTDFDADGNPMETVVRLSATQIDPVKGLKVTYVDDQNITINFTHPSNLDENDTGSVYDYAFEIKDARGNVVDKRVISNPNKVFDIDGVNAKDLKRVQSWFQHTRTAVDDRNPKHKAIVVDNTSALGFNYYTGTKTKTKTFAYTYTNPKLVRLSAYTISVTPLFENQKANKAAVKKTKTTNIPACTGDVDITGAGTDKLGGHPLLITSSNRQSGGAAQAAQNITDRYRLISGNTYTLQLVPDDNAARDRVTDTLTWKSSNTKVASIKANAGTYTAAFKAVNQGRTTITVTSKITKKVIARWTVTVYAVKDGSSYGGDYEPTWQNGFYENILALYDPFYEGRLEVLSMNVPLVINNKDAEGNINNNVRTWVSFTAPHYGQYTFSRNIVAYDSRDGKIVGNNTKILFLEANQKVYFKIEGNATLNVTGTELARLTKAHIKDAPLEVKTGYVSFTAWEDNVYTFWHNGKELVIDDKTETGMEAGETKFILVGSDGKMYVTWREEVAEEELKLGSHATGTVAIDKDNQVRYISFTANAAGEYAFQYTEVSGVTVTFSTADGNGLAPVYNEAKGTETETVKSFYLEEGEKIVIEFKADPEITDDAKKFSVSVTVTAQQRRKLQNGTITIPKGTSELVEYEIPSFTAERVKFKFGVSGETGTNIIRYLDKDYQLLKLNANSLILSKDSDIKTGDSIYIMVQAGGSADDKDAKDAVLTVTQVPADTITADSEKTKEITNDTEQWYTFTAPKDGYYEFGVTVAERAESDNTPTHDARLAFHSELFGTLLKTNITTEIRAMKTGEMLAIKLNPGYVEDIVKEGATKEDGTKEESTTEVVKSNAAVYVKTLDIKPLAVGGENAEKVQMPAKSKEVRYYSFTAAVGADYTISWQAADAKTDNAKVTYFSSMTAQGGAQTVATNGSSMKLKTGEVRYVKVEIDDSESENAVNGTLCVTALNLSADALTAGTAYPFRLEDRENTDGEGVQKVVKFTAPEAGWYAVITTVDNHPVSELPYDYPMITTGGVNIGVPSASVKFAKGETKYFTLSFTATGEVKETAGTIMIRSLAEPFTGEQMDVSVANGNFKEYTYIIPESGRYEFKADYDKEKATAEWKDVADKVLGDGNYYQKNTKVKVTVTGKDEEADASVKLYKPALISTTPLNVGENAVEVKAGETKYYELSVGSEPKAYEFELSDITSSATVNMTRTIDDKNNWTMLSDNSAVPMKKNSKLIIKITSSSEKKDANCKLNITERQELKLGDNAVHLEPGESRNLIYRIPETGYYSFYINQPGAELVLNYNYNYDGNKYSDTKTGDSFYDFTKLLKAKETQTRRLTNEGSSAVDLTLILATIEPVELTPGSKTEAITIPAGQRAHYALKTFKNAEYLMRIADTSKGEDLAVSLNDTNVTGELKRTADSVTIEKNLGGESLLCITNNGIKETSATVELMISEAQPLPNEAITLGKNESRLISFVATEDTRYLITKDNEDVTMTLVSEQKVSDGTTTKPGTTVGAYTEKLLNKGDKLIYRLSYNVDEKDEKAAPEQTVNVKIAPIQPANIEAESTPVTIAEKDNKSVWYQFTAVKDAVHTFTLEDEYGNEVSDCMTFYRYFTDDAGKTEAERHMKTGRKVYINVKYPDAGSYTLKYTTVEAITETGVRTLDFEYNGEVQEIKFVVPKGGIYKVSATAVRGGFTVEGKTGARTVVTPFSTNGGTRTELLKKDDIVTFTVKATQGGKSSVTLRIAEDNMADTLTVGKEYAGVSDTEKEIYHELRIEKKALYAITAGGEPTVRYAVNDSSIKTINGVVYEDLDKDDRIIIKVGKTTAEKAYTIKIEEISAVSLDGRNKEEEPYSVSAGDNYYGFTTANAYVQFKVPEDGYYYIAMQTVNDNTGYGGMIITAPAPTPAPDPAETSTPAAKAVLGKTWIEPLIKDQIVKITLTNSSPKDEENPALAYKEALFRLTIKKAADDENAISAGETKSDSLAASESIRYQFKAAEAGKYIISFNGSNCVLDGASDGEVKSLAKDAVLTLTVKTSSSSKAGSYTLTVAKLSPETLTLGVTAQKTLKKNETVYYEFASTETTDTGETTYQIYISGNNVQYTYSEVDAEGKETGIYGAYTNCNHEVALKKGEKLAFTVRNSSTTDTRGFELTVKKVDYTAVKADTPVSGSLEAYENGYYEFTSEDDSANGTAYKVFIADSDSVRIQKIQKAAWEKDSEGKDILGTPTDVTNQKTVTLKKGEKLLITALNDSSKTAQFKLTVEKEAEAAVTYDAIALDEKKAGKLANDEKAGYEFTVSDAADYSVYFSGTACSYTWTTTVEKQETDADGNPTTKTETVTESGTLSSGSNEFTWKNGDKIRFTISGTAKYELIVKKVTYTPLALDTAVAKTPSKGETVYYQFTSQDDPATGETTTKYQVYGSFDGYTVQTRIATVGEDGKTTETNWSNRSNEYDLKKGQILQFKVTNKGTAVNPCKMTIKKVQYSAMTLGTAVEGRLDIAENGYVYYEFISQDDPAEGQTTTEYQIYGTAYYYYSKVTVNEDKTLSSNGWNYQSTAKKIALAKGERLRFKVSGSYKSAEGYNLTVAKTDEKAVTVGSKTETGSLGRGQELVYTLKYDKDTPATYTLNYEQTDNVNITVSGGNRIDGQRIELSKGDTLRITITSSGEVDNFAFTLSEFKPEIMTLGTMTSLKKLALNETVYYQYTVGEDGSYVLSMVESEAGRLNLAYEVSRANAVGQSGTISGDVGEIALQKDDVVLFKVTAPGTKAIAAFSFKLMLQKKTAADAMTALPWNGTLKQGEVKYLKFTIPEEKKADDTKYTLSIPYTLNGLKYRYDGNLYDISITQPGYNTDISDDFVLRVANISMYNEAECNIDVQENPYADLGASTKEGTIAKGKTEYYKYTPPETGVYVLEYSGDVKVQYSTDQTATKSWNSVSNTVKRKINVTDSARTIYLTITYNGAEDTASYKVSINEAPYEVPENFGLRASAATACIGSDKLYLYLDTDIEVDQITVYYGRKGSNTKQKIDLYDDGNTAHGDDMKGDGTYSTILYPTGSEDMEMQFNAEYGQEKSNTVTIKYYMPLTDDIYTIMDDVDDEIDKLLDASDFAEKTDDEKLAMVTTLLNGLVEEDKILDNSIVVDQTNSIVSFQYPGKIYGGIMYGEFEEDSNGELSGTIETDITDETGGDKEKKTSYPERNTYIPASAYANAVNTQQSQEIGKALILNSFPGFETSSSAITFRTGFYETLKSEWDEAGLKTLLDTDVTVDDYKKLHNYNVVCVSTHGSIYPVSESTAYPAICLNQPQSGENNKKYMAELKSQQVAKVNGSYWILPSFFTAQYGEGALEDTFVFSECCMAMGSDESGSNKQMANAFTGRGAKAYTGFYNSVLAVYSREFMKEYVNNLIGGRTSGEAYKAAVDKHGQNDGQGAYPVHNGDINAVLINDYLQNGDFETVNFSTTAPRFWACMGDVRTLTQIGEVKPYDGSKRMAIITTGIGAKESAVFEGGTEGSMLSQTFRVPDGVKTLYFDYDFISEEPREYVGSIFDDNFGIRISNGGNTVLDKTYESINTSEWKIIEGVNFAGGDDTAFHTDWKTAEVDVSAYSGEVITLSFIIYDVGDRIYDSACVIDNVMLQ